MARGAHRRYQGTARTTNVPRSAPSPHKHHPRPFRSPGTVAEMLFRQRNFRQRGRLPHFEPVQWQRGMRIVYAPYAIRIHANQERNGWPPRSNGSAESVGVEALRKCLCVVGAPLQTLIRDAVVAASHFWGTRGSVLEPPKRVPRVQVRGKCKTAHTHTRTSSPAAADRAAHVLLAGT